MTFPPIKSVLNQQMDKSIINRYARDKTFKDLENTIRIFKPGIFVK